MEAKVRIEHPPVVLHTRPALEMDEGQFFELCPINRGWRIERSAEGDLEIMVPTGGRPATGTRRSRCTRALQAEAEVSTSVPRFRGRAALTVGPPDDGEAKMREYVENGARPGWLIDPEHQVHVYEPGREVLRYPEGASGDPVLPDFVLDLRPIRVPSL